MISSQDKTRQLEERTINFSVDVMTFCKKTPKNPQNKIITDQLMRSASSIGANYSEAINAASRIDFRNKIFTAKKEAAETRYWLRVLAKVDGNLDTAALQDEASQLHFILQKIVSTLKNGK